MKKTKKILKWVLRIAGVLLLLAGIFYGIVSYNIHKRKNKVYTFAPETLALDTSAASLQRGAHLIATRGCDDCHGKDLSGQVFIDDGGFARIVARNLTPGKGGLGKSYTTNDWLMALRHGINKEGKPLLFMPSHETAPLSKEDLSSLIAYCQQLPPVDKDLPGTELRPMIKLLTYFGKIPLFSVEMIDHQQPAIEAATKEVGVEQGKYISVSCQGCHRPDLKGGPGVAPGMPTVPNITASGSLKNWQLSDFQKTLKTGVVPGGRQLEPKDMPWTMTAKYTDDEIQSIYLYLKSVK